MRTTLVLVIILYRHHSSKRLLFYIGLPQVITVKQIIEGYYNIHVFESEDARI